MFKKNIKLNMHKVKLSSIGNLSVGIPDLGSFRDYNQTLAHHSLKPINLSI